MYSLHCIDQIVFIKLYSFHQISFLNALFFTNTLVKSFKSSYAKDDLVRLDPQIAVTTALLGIGIIFLVGKVALCRIFKLPTV